jgi:hypothetical protein
MTTRLLRGAFAAFAAFLSLPSSAHDLACAETVGAALTQAGGTIVLGADGLPVFAAGPATTFAIDAYPAEVAVRIHLQNLVPETSVVSGVEDSLAAFGGSQYGAAIVPGFSLAPEASSDRVVVLSVPSYEACLALAGGGGESGDGPTCGAGSLETRFAVTHDIGSAECRARLVCRPPPPVTACQTPQWTGAIDVPYAMRGVVDALGRVAIVGTAIGPRADQPRWNDRMLSIVGPAGEVTTLARWGGDYASAEFVAEDSSGNILVAGNGTGPWYPPPLPGYLAKVASDGSLTWETTLGVLADPNDGDVLDLALDGSGSSYVSMRPYGHEAASVAKVDPTGALVWETNVGSRYALLPLAVGPTGVFTAYHLPLFADFGTDVDVVVVKLDLHGNEVWTRSYATPDPDYPRGFAPNTSGATLVGVSVAWGADQFTPGVRAGFAARFDDAGNQLWSHRFAEGTTTTDVVTDATDAAWVLGETDVSSFVAKLDAAGNELWSVPLPGGEFGNSISLDCAGDAYVVGSSDGGARTFVRRVAAGGEL